jgi:segregation and condensation protein B
MQDDLKLIDLSRTMDNAFPIPELKAEVEAILFASEQAVSLAELCRILSAFHEIEVAEAELELFMQELMQEYAQSSHGFEVVKAGGGYLFMTKKNLQAVLAVALSERSKKKLSQAALETLSIIAYKQPVTKTELEHIRGVSCDYSLQKLLERNLIELAGKSNGPGRPLLYRTSNFFMEYFGLNGMEELPQLKELDNQDNSIGMPEAEE